MNSRPSKEQLQSPPVPLYRRLMRFLKRSRKALITGGLLCCVLLFAGAQLWITRAYEARIFSSLDQVPPRKVALLLGTAKHFMGYGNLYYIYRIRAAAELYHAGKVRGILISGDNGSKGYDEPTDMRDDLIKAGVNPQHITLDYAGFRTLDSVIRAEKIFGQTDYIVVSQKFHCQRSLFLGAVRGHQAIAYTAEDVPVQEGGLQVQLREVLARSKALLDVLTFKGPKFLGPPEPLNLRPKS